MEPATFTTRELANDELFPPHSFDLRVLAKDQPEYLQLEVIVWRDDPMGTMTSKWRPSWRDRLRLLFGGSIYMSQMTFRELFRPVKLATTFEEAV
jgi:hypothetical protein